MKLRHFTQCSDFLNFSIIATGQLWGLNPFRKPVWYLEKMFSNKEEIWSHSTFSKILDRFGRTLIGRKLLFSYRESFLYTGMMFANFRIERKEDELIDLITYPNIKGEKKCTFCFIHLVGISDEWDTLFMFKLFISFSTSVRNTVFRKKLKLHFSRIVLILWWFWYLHIPAKISSPFYGVWQSKLFGTLRSKLGTKFWKYLKVTAISKSSVSILPFSIRDIFSKLFDLSEKKLFPVFQNVLLSTMFFTFRFE